jgi:nitrogen regulatory protein PII
MKLIIGIIRPYHLELLQAALEREGVSLTSVSEVLAGGEGDGYTLIYRERQVKVRKPKYRVEILVDDFQVEEIAAAIRSATASGCPGNVSDAKVMILQLAEAAPARREPAVRVNGTRSLCPV